ncbi:MAG: DUF4386 domain-containing protein [Candidatus Eremiobacteraeota bacterium]|nr:DUF4386 domain-containing protein [Candidatus Eremiobacteraeota bacterium]
MSDVRIATEARQPPASAASISTYARIAGALLLVGFVAGGFGELFVPSKLIVPADATATAHNIMASESLFRMGFVGYLVEAVCDVSTTLLLYVLLRPVNKNLALLAAFFGLVGTATYAIAEFFYFAALQLLEGATYLRTFSPEQLNTLALLSLKLYGDGAEVFMAFGGVGSIIVGYLIFRSCYLPKTLGVLLALAGLGFITINVALVLAPAYASPVLLLPVLLATLSLALWLLVKGVDVPKWVAAVSRAESADREFCPTSAMSP